MTVNQLEKELKDGNLTSIYLLYGKETYLLENAVKKIKKLFGNLVEGLNYIKIDNANLDSLIPELQTPSFGFEKKLIIVKDTDLLKKQAKKKAQFIIDKIEKVASYISENIDDIKEQNILVFIEEDVDKNKLYKELEKVGLVCNFEAEKLPEISKRIKYICNAYSVNIDSSTLNYFIESCGTNMQDLINEIRKLIEYVGKEGTIKKEDIDLLSTKQFESVIFDLTDSLGQKNVSKSLEVLKNLIYSKEPIQKILITLYNHFKKLYIVKLCEKYKKDLSENLKLKPNQMFLVSKYKRQSSYFSENELRNILFQFVKLDEEYKSGIIDLNIGLESVICGYCC
ncbi:MAG: DNA polymerase III subunit delta [Clostridia bacterium]|nr:DNA polymerase III subunit delta [Clostridia bacterium]